MGEGVGVWGCMHAAVLLIFPIQVAMVAMLKKNESQATQQAFLYNEIFPQSGCMQIGARTKKIITPCLLDFFLFLLRFASVQNAENALCKVMLTTQAK